MLPRLCSVGLCNVTFIVGLHTMIHRGARGPASNKHKMESKRSRTIVSTTITTEPSSNEDSPSTEALQHQINDLTHQISLLQSKTDELAQMVRSIRAPGQDVHRRDDPADGPLALKHLNRPVQACNCQCTSHDARPNTIGR